MSEYCTRMKYKLIDICLSDLKGDKNHFKIFDNLQCISIINSRIKKITQLQLFSCFTQCFVLATMFGTMKIFRYCLVKIKLKVISFRIPNVVHIVQTPLFCTNMWHTERISSAIQHYTLGQMKMMHIKIGNTLVSKKGRVTL